MFTPWPRLTFDLKGPRAYGCCQGCGAMSQPTRGLPSLTLWQECDDSDAGEPSYLWLCTTCSEKHVANHPRHYNRLHSFYPAAGSQRICAECAHCVNLKCHHRDAGLKPLIVPGPYHRSFVDAGGRGRHGRIGWTATYFYAAATACRGFQEAPVEL